MFEFVGPLDRREYQTGLSGWILVLEQIRDVTHRAWSVYLRTAPERDPHIRPDGRVPAGVNLHRDPRDEMRHLVALLHMPVSAPTIRECYRMPVVCRVVESWDLGVLDYLSKAA